MIDGRADHEAPPREQEAIWQLAETTSPFLSREWFELLAEHVTEPGSLRIYQSRADAVRALLPMHRIRSRFLGLSVRELASLTNFYSPVFAPLLAPGAQSAREELCTELARAIAADAERWDLVRIAPLAAEDGLLDELERSLRGCGWWTQRYFCFGNWHLPCAGLTFTRYMQARPGSLRTLLDRKARRLAREGAAEYEIATSEAEVRRALDAYEAVYARSWKTPERYPAFVPALARLGVSKGWTRLGILRLDGQPIAAQLWLVANRVAYIFKLAHDPAHGPLSPGSLLTARLMEHVLERDAVGEVDYLLGDDAYKALWMTRRRERWGLLAFRKASPAGCALAARHVWGRALRRGAAGVLAAVRRPRAGDAQRGDS